LSGECKECRRRELTGKGNTPQRAVATMGGRDQETAPAIVHEVLHSHGAPLDADARRFFEPRFGFDFSRVRIHTDARAAKSARTVNALAYTFGNDIAFAAGQYAPRAASGQRLLAHELAHVAQQSAGPRANSNLRLASPTHRGELEANSAARQVLAGSQPSAMATVPAMVQRFTASLGSGDKVLIHPEKGDKDADLDKVLCPAITDRKIGKRKDIDVTGCLPKSTIKAMGMGPYNCSDFVRSSLGDFPASKSQDLDRMLTPKLWDELLKKAFTIRGLAVVKKSGKVEPAEGTSWKQRDPQMGDIAFMRGGIRLNKGEKEPSAKGDNFTVSWDHVGIFIVRSRNGFDYHFAKDGDENPIGVYHTGSGEEETMIPGAYVKGAETLAAYLAPSPEPKKEKKTEAPPKKAPASKTPEPKKPPEKK
jgi:hypothetical protein